MQRWSNQREIERPSRPIALGPRAKRSGRKPLINRALTESRYGLVAHSASLSIPLQCAGLIGSSSLFALPAGLATFVGVTIAGFAQAGLRRLFRRRASNRHQRRSVTKMADGSIKFSVATYNLRGIMDRWQERRPLLAECLKEMDADVLCFQECMTAEYGQDRSLLGPAYHIFPCKAALSNLLASGNALLSMYARTVSGFLSVRPFQKLMISTPEPLEAFRERFRLEAAPFRVLRDLAIAPFFGNSVACRLAEAHEIKHSTLLLGDWRAAQRIEFSIDSINSKAKVDGAGDSTSKSTRASKKNNNHTDNNPDDGTYKIWIVNMHLDHAHPDNRQRQAIQVAKWMEDARDEVAAVVLCGDMNGAPYEPFHAALRNLGYRSGYFTKHGREPFVTWPTGIQAPLMDHGERECLDYVYIWAAEGYELNVADAAVFGNTHDKKDKTLYPSDHAAVKVTLQLKRRNASRK